MAILKLTKENCEEVNIKNNIKVYNKIVYQNNIQKMKINYTIK